MRLGRRRYGSGNCRECSYNFLEYVTLLFFHRLHIFKAIAFFFKFLEIYHSVTFPFQIAKLKFGNRLNIDVGVPLFLGPQMQKQL